MTPEAVLQELDGLRALARSLVHGDADADDLLQDTAVAALEHPPALDHRPVRAWLGAVLRNRWRMDRRSAVRRQAREHAVALAGADAPGDDATAGIGRARALERLAAALVALDEPFRTAVIRRYLDGRSAAELARELGVPASTVRWRLRTGLGRLRAALDDSSPRWQRAFLPLLGVTVKTKTSDQHPIGYARVVREASSGGASIQPANAGALSRPDGTFELTGIPRPAVGHDLRPPGSARGSSPA